MHLEAAGGRVGDGQRQRHFVELGLLVLILRQEQKKTEMQLQRKHLDIVCSASAPFCFDGGR
jgi:hypothetical protein